MEQITETEQIRFDRAQKHVRALSGFYRHLAAYLIINLFLIGSRYFMLGEHEQFWVFQTFSTAFYWGIGIAFHGIGVFGQHVFFGTDWEQRKIREIMEKKSKTTNSRWE